ncbi:hypothetical protein NE237_008094 [Protea cynaroides]|uniref:Uncharacterized protein n=1 Tax=Protea cynaroides TaxID=273540 RepID=A0A9Q0QWR7_9MAGN|nr:hypothetical protein NE237_008094 [Protea cynaroides]
MTRPIKIVATTFIDITNDSPIVGLAGGSLETPFSFAKKRDLSKKTPGFREALLWGQVKSLCRRSKRKLNSPNFLSSSTHSSISQSKVSDLDSSERSSALTNQKETYGREKSVEEDNALVWFIQVNASSKGEYDGEEIVEGEEIKGDYYYYKKEDEEKVGGGATGAEYLTNCSKV